MPCPRVRTCTLSAFAFQDCPWLGVMRTGACSPHAAALAACARQAEHGQHRLVTGTSAATQSLNARGATGKKQAGVVAGAQHVSICAHQLRISRGPAAAQTGGRHNSQANWRGPKAKLHPCNALNTPLPVGPKHPDPKARGSNHTPTFCSSGWPAVLSTGRLRCLWLQLVLGLLSTCCTAAAVAGGLCAVTDTLGPAGIDTPAGSVADTDTATHRA
jgi:hypothetical protein